jgi:Pyridine nucleotide-disulphide oxidoreductase
MSQPRNVAVIGAGPVGLAAAAHAIERGINPTVLEAGSTIGHAVRDWSHVRMFSPWRYNTDKAAARLLQAVGWNAPDPQSYPTGAELLAQYLEPLAARTNLREHIVTEAAVTAVSRVGFDKAKTKGREIAPFHVRYGTGKGEKSLLADAVIDTSGTWFSPSPAGANGLAAIGEADVAERVRYGAPDVFTTLRDRYAGKLTAVLGSGHSAIGTLLDLARLKDEVPETQIIWIIRGDNPEKSFGGGENDQLAARGELGTAFARLVNEGRLRVETGFHLSHLGEQDGQLRIGAGGTCCGRHLLVDELIVATGSRPNLSFLSELRLGLDPSLDCPIALAPLIDPNEHSCGTVRPHGAAELAHPEPGFYIAGMKSYGRAPTFLMMTGYEQVRSIVAELAGDRGAARRVELELPETGVCSVSRDGASDCCGGPAKADAEACCAADEAAEGAAGCGCGPVPARPETACCG